MVVTISPYKEALNMLGSSTCECGCFGAEVGSDYCSCTRAEIIAKAWFKKCRGKDLRNPTNYQYHWWVEELPGCYVCRGCHRATKKKQKLIER